MVVDLSATPFRIKGSNYPEGQPFPWIVSDFGLVDAIESGITKIPRLPVQDTTGPPGPEILPAVGGHPRQLAAGRAAARPFRQAKARGGLARGGRRADAAHGAVEGAIRAYPGGAAGRGSHAALPHHRLRQHRHRRGILSAASAASRWWKPSPKPRCRRCWRTTKTEAGSAGRSARKKPKPRVGLWTGRGVPRPVQQHAQTGNTPSASTASCWRRPRRAIPARSKADAAEELRRVVATVGKRGEPGEHVRCVVSVAMLTEGWDANTVTQILGLRAFTSQLLCEQVVGRGLRRMDYQPDPDTGLLTEEYCDVYGVPFSVIPFRGRPVNKPEPDDTPPNLVKALPERAAMEIRFPVVEGYAFALRHNLIRCDIDAMERLRDRAEPRTDRHFRAPAGRRARGRRHGGDAIAIRFRRARPAGVLQVGSPADDFVPGRAARGGGTDGSGARQTQDEAPPQRVRPAIAACPVPAGVSGGRGIRPPQGELQRRAQERNSGWKVSATRWSNVCATRSSRTTPRASHRCCRC